MWIKYNNALYNTDGMMSIKLGKTNINVIFLDGSKMVLGRFRTSDEAHTYYQKIVQGCLAAGTDHEGMIIRDTKEK